MPETEESREESTPVESKESLPDETSENISESAQNVESSVESESETSAPAENSENTGAEQTLNALSLNGTTEKGTCGDLTWTLDDQGCLTISGKGEFEGISSCDPTLETYQIDSVVIEDGVTAIGASAFQSCWSMDSVTIPDSVKTIGESAFSYCNNLKSVTIPDSVENIGESAFSYCSNLKSVTIPDSVETIGASAFQSCWSMDSVTIPDSVETIGASAFRSCWSMNSVTIPDSVKTIGESAFSDCSDLKSVTIPDSVETIGASAFRSCGLNSIKIPAGVKTIGESAFESCGSLQHIYIPKETVSIAKNAFRYCPNYSWRTLVISCEASEAPEGWEAGWNVSDEEGNSFTVNYGVTPNAGIVVASRPGKTVYEVGEEFNSDGLTVAVVYSDGTYDSTLSSSEYTLTGFTGETGDNVITVTYNADPSWTTTFKVSVKGAKSGTCGENLTWTLSDDYVLTIEGSGDMDCYGSAVPTSIYSGFYAVSGCWSEYASEITAVNLPEGLTSIAPAAFYYFTSLTSIEIPASVRKIGSFAFYFCSNLQEIRFGDEYMTKNYNIATGGDISEMEKVPSEGQNPTTANLADVSNYAFGYCVSLTNLYLPESLRTVGEAAFYACENLQTVSIASNVSEISDAAFSGCSRLLSVDFKTNSLSEISDGCFLGCSALPSVTLPESVTDIGDSAFDSCRSLTSVTLPESVTDIGDSAFARCYSLTELTIPSKVTSIGDWAFDYCSDLSEVTLSDNITSFGENVFDGCYDLDTLGLSGTDPDFYAKVLSSVLSENVITKLSVPCSFSDYWNLTSAQTRLQTAAGVEYTWDIREHTYTESSVIPYVCKDKGPSDATVCDVCGEYVERTHAEKTLTEAVDATETEDGNTARIGCEYCDAILQESEILPATAETSGTCGENLTWKMTSDGILTVTGSGDFYDADGYPGEIWEADKVKKVIIEKGATNVGSYAFANCTNLTSVTLPEGVVSIDDKAFAECSRLRNFALPTTLKSIKTNAFLNCSSLTQLVLPASLTEIGVSAFSTCKNLKEVITPEGQANLESIGDSAFCFCINLKTVTLPGSVKSIGAQAFLSCRNLTSIELPAALTSIGESAFSSCTSLTSIELPAALTSIGESAFNFCSSLTDIQIPASVTDIGNQAFAYCQKLKTVFIPKTVTTMGSCVFHSYWDLVLYCEPEQDLEGWSSKWNNRSDWEWSTEKFTTYYGAVAELNGVIYQNDGTTPAAGAKAELWQGSTKLNECTAGEDGKYSFKTLRSGKYNILVPDAQLKVLTDAEAKYAELKAAAEKEAADKAAADATVAKITAIGEVAYTADSKALIDAARTAYDAMTADQKKLVPDAQLKVLTDAEAKYAELKKAADQAAADAAIEKINDIGTVEYTDACKTKIDTARSAYDALTADQKKLVAAAELKTLTDAEDKYAELKKEAEKSADAGKDIRLSGDTRYETSASIAEKAFPNGASEIVLVTGEKFPDALSAAAYAGKHNCPIVISGLNTLDPSVKALILKWGCKKVTIIGGGFSDTLKNTLRNECGASVTEITPLRDGSQCLQGRQLQYKRSLYRGNG